MREKFREGEVTVVLVDAINAFVQLLDNRRFMISELIAPLVFYISIIEYRS